MACQNWSPLCRNWPWFHLCCAGACAYKYKKHAQKRNHLREKNLVQEAYKFLTKEISVVNMHKRKLKLSKSIDLTVLVRNAWDVISHVHGDSPFP